MGVLLAVVVLASSCADDDAEAAPEDEASLTVTSDADTEATEEPTTDAADATTVPVDAEPVEGLPGFTHQVEAINGVQYHWVRGGDGPPIVLLHGWPETWYLWRHVLPELAENYTVIAPDLRGLGATERVAAGYDAATVAQDIRALVEANGFDSIDLVGHDVGGWVSFAYAQQFGESVNTLTILDVPIPDATIDQLGALTNPATIWHFTFHEAQDVPEFLVEGREELYLRWFYETFSYSADAIGDDEVNEYLRYYSGLDSLTAGFEYYRALEQDVLDNAQFGATPLEMPVLALGGEAAVGAFVQQQMSGYANDVRGGVLEECGHWIPSECPDAFMDELSPFLEENRP